MHKLALTLLVAVTCVAACATQPEEATVEIDGAWVRTFRTDRDAAYHAIMDALTDRGYTVDRANPMGGSFSAKSAVESRPLGVIAYRLARVDIEPAPERGVRIRLSIVSTHEPAGGGRRPNNDRPLRSRAVYDDIFDAVARSTRS